MENGTPDLFFSGGDGNIQRSATSTDRILLCVKINFVLFGYCLIGKCFLCCSFVVVVVVSIRIFIY